MIAAAAGRSARGRSILTHLLAHSPGFDPLFAGLAREQLRALR
jgi:hypothetical protein